MNEENNEIWKPIKKHEDRYEISNRGRIRSIKTNTIYKLSGNRDGYLQTYLQVGPNLKYKHLYAHRQVAISFLKKIRNKKEVNHIDGNKNNNNVSNLEWCNRSENLKHAYKNNLLKKVKDRNNKISI